MYVSYILNITVFSGGVEEEDNDDSEGGGEKGNKDSISRNVQLPHCI